jgi:hypothetical protein
MERDVCVFGDGVGLEVIDGFQVLAADYRTLVDIASSDVDGVTTQAFSHKEICHNWTMGPPEGCCRKIEGFG